jgi:WD40 repeat protein
MPDFNPNKAHLTHRVQGATGFWSVALDAASQRLFVGATDFTIPVYSAATWQPDPMSPLKGAGSYVTALVYLRKHGLLVSAGFDRQLIWWKPALSDPMLQTVSVETQAHRLAVNPDETLIAAATSDRITWLFDAATGKLVRTMQGGHESRTGVGRESVVYSVAFSPDGKRLATGARAGDVCVWEVETGKLLTKLPAPAFYSQGKDSEYEWGGVRSLAFTPDGNFLAAGGMGPADQNSAGIDGLMRIELFDLKAAKSVAGFQLPEHKGMLTAMAFHPQGNWLVAVGGGGGAGDGGVGTVCCWEWQRKAEDNKPAPAALHRSKVVLRDFAFSADAAKVFAVGMEGAITKGVIEVWDLTV